MMKANPRVRAVIAAGSALVVIAGIGIGVATTSTAADSRWVTATASTGDVTQSYLATGSITRKNTEAATFTVSGTVKQVNVAVGDTVEIGDTLAVLKKGPLQLAVLDAETSVARAKAALYAAEHPSSTSTGRSSGSGSGGSASGVPSGGVTIDPAVLNEAASRINLAVLTEAEKCEPVFGSILPSPEPSETPSVSPSPTADPTDGAEPSATAEPTEESEPTVAAEPSAGSEPTATAEPAPAEESSEDPEPTPTASQLADTIEANDPTEAELQECANARAEVLAANTNLQAVVQQLVSPTPGSGSGSGSASAKKASSSSSSSSSVSAAQVAAAEADLLAAQQELQAAKDDLASTELLAPISGTVGTVELAKGDSASAGSITIVGEGNAVVTFELPLQTRAQVSIGQEVTVTPAGAGDGLSGKVTAISPLETSGTAGDNPTYSTTVAVSDPESRLATGGKASVAIAVKSATGIVRVPTSAATPTGTGTATVQVLATAGAETPDVVTVQTGAVGGGWVEITSGLTAGDIVVLADRTAEIPANTTGRRMTTGSSSTGRATTAASPSAGTASPSAGTASPSAGTASPQPTATR